MSRILIADDQRDVLEALRILLKGEGYQTEGVTSLPGVYHALEKKEYALLLMDLNYTRGTIPDLIAQSPAMRPVVEMISRVAPSDANVLITGENGTGKSLIAHAIHG